MYSTLESIRPLINYFNSFERYVTKTTVSDTYEVVAGDTLTVVVSAGSSATITFEEAVVAPEYNIAISGYGLSLDAELIISAKFAIPVELQNDAGASIKVQFINDVTEYNLVEYINENGIDGKNRIVIKQSVKSPYMTHLITVTITDGNGNAADYTDYFGEAHTGSYSFGAEEYVKTMHLVGGTTVTAVRGLLTYGAYAQKYFKTTGTANITDELATEMLIRNGYEPLDISGFSTTMLKEKTVGTGDDFDGISIRGGQPDLAAAISMKVQFNASGLTSAADIANYTYKLHVTVGDQTIEKELNTPEWDNARKRLVFYVYDIPAMFFDNLYSITVTKTATGETYTGSTSITAFIGEAYAAYSNDVPLQQLLAAMYYYNDAANTHFGN